MRGTRETLGALLESCAAGDAVALERIYQLSASKLYGLVTYIVRREDWAEDVLQEGYIKIWRSARRYNPARGTPMTWMAGIMRNCAIDWMRSQPAGERVSDAVMLEWIAGEEDAELDDFPRLRHLQRCLATLTPEQRETLVLAYYRGYTHQELADHMNKPLGSIKSWIRRGLMRLRECMDDAGDPPAGD